MSFPRRPLAEMDCEVFRDYFLCKWRDVDAPYAVRDFEMWPGVALDRAGLLAVIQARTAVTFNGINYDAVIVAAAMQGFDCAQIKYLSDAIIQRKMRPWEAMREFGLLDVPGFDQIDLIEIPPGQASLKIYGGKMHSKRIQDLPVDHTASISPELRPVVNNYCGNDLLTTRDLREMFAVQIRQREDISEQYGLDLRSKSDAQIAEAVIRKQLTFTPERPNIFAGTAFRYEAPPWVYFQTDTLRNLLRDICAVPFVIGDSGVLQLPEFLKALRVTVGSNSYTVRMGGLHSTETVCCHVGGNIEDIDVASYYPELIDKLGLFPTQIGPGFLAIFRKLKAARLAAKAAGDKKLADMLKIVINGAYGKLGSPWSILYAPQLMLQVTITGQLALLMLIEAMELNSIQCISANTDGLVLKCADGHTAQRLAVRAWWEQVTGFKLEATPYAAIFIRDVNSYVAFKPDGEAKKKGEFSDPVPVASSWPNPECQISVDAMVAYLRDGTPIEHTVRSCVDVRKFVAVRKVQGGGFFGGVPLGRAVRWYYSKAGGCILNSKGHMVSQSEGSRPMMQLTDTLPADLDFDYYVIRAKRMLLTVGVQFCYTLN